MPAAQALLEPGPCLGGAIQLKELMTDPNAEPAAFPDPSPRHDTQEISQETREAGPDANDAGQTHEQCARQPANSLIRRVDGDANRPTVHRYTHSLLFGLWRCA